MTRTEWEHHNVALWMNNDLGYWSLAQECLRMTGNLKKATDMFRAEVGYSTPDGAKFTKRAIRAALRDLRGPM